MFNKKNAVVSIYFIDGFTHNFSNMGKPEILIFENINIK